MIFTHLFMSISTSTQRLTTIILTVFVAFFGTRAQAQCVINSTAGYQVSVGICPESIIVSSTDCPNGYNYNVRFSYNIQLTGSNVQQLYTLQTLIDCNNGQQNGYYELPKSGGSGHAITTTNPFINTDGAAYTYTTHPSCTQATVNNLNCLTLKVIIQGPGIPYQVVDCNCTTMPLPVTFLGFTAEKTTEGNLLQWSTASEQRNKWFSIETSFDGQNWSLLRHIEAVGNSTEKNEYAFIDETNYTSSVYYKLSQTDEDGVRNELSIAYIDHAAEAFVVSPNPTNDGVIALTTPSGLKGEVDFVLYNTLGQQVGFWTSEGTLLEQDGSVRLDHQLQSGTYQLMIQNNGTTLQRTKLIVP